MLPRWIERARVEVESRGLCGAVPSYGAGSSNCLPRATGCGGSNCSQFLSGMVRMIREVLGGRKSVPRHSYKLERRRRVMRDSERDRTMRNGLAMRLRRTETSEMLKPAANDSLKTEALQLGKVGIPPGRTGDQHLLRDASRRRCAWRQAVC